LDFLLLLLLRVLVLLLLRGLVLLLLCPLLHRLQAAPRHRHVKLGAFKQSYTSNGQDHVANSVTYLRQGAWNQTFSQSG
jgi:hypothetical protein